MEPSESTTEEAKENGSTQLTELLTSENEQNIERPSGFGMRHQFAVIACFVCFNIGAVRANLGLTIVTMVNKGANNVIQSNTSNECQSSSNATFERVVQDGLYNWDEKTQGILLGSFFYGYIVTQIPGGRMAEIIGPKIVTGISIMLMSICTLVTPVSADLHFGALLTVRIVLGLSQGATIPCINFMIGKWSPRSELTTISVFIYGGSTVGLILSMAISGVLCSSDFLGGWSSVYYIFGTVACISTALWFIFVHDSPAEHPKISGKERNYIERSVGSKKNLKIPYKSMMKSPAVWAICIAHMAHAWGFYTIFTCFPLYMNRIQKFDVTQSGILMAVLYITCWFVSMLSGVMSDLIRRREWLSTSNTRKLCNSLGTFLGALCLVLIKIAGCDYITVIALVISSNALVTLCDSGYSVNHLDIAPNFAGTFYGFTNTLATACGIISPYLVGVLTQNNQTMAQWQIVFYISAAIYVFGGLVFLFFSKGVLQKWNDKTTIIIINVPSKGDLKSEQLLTVDSNNKIPIH